MENSESDNNNANEFEKKFETWIETKIGKSKIVKEGEKFGNVIGIIITLLMIWAAHNVLNWTQPIFDFVKDDFVVVIWAIDLTLGMAIITKIIRIISSNYPTKGILKIIDNIFSFFLTLILLTIFPYDFQKLINISWINDLFKILFILGLFGLFFGTFVEFTKLLKFSFNYTDKQNP